MVDFRALFEGFRNEGIFLPLVLIIGGFSRFPSAQKPPLSASLFSEESFHLPGVRLSHL